MFSILVVEDEKWIRKGIVRKLEKSDISFSDIYDAKDGNEALEIIKTKKVEIIITDICMPDMNGIELIKLVKDYLSHIEFIIISGYSEFKYAEEAINMGVRSYLLKPTTDEDLKKALNKVINNLKEKKQYNALSKENVNIKLRNEKLIYEKELNHLLKSQEKNSNSELLQKYYPYIFHNNYYQLLILNIDYNSRSESKIKCCDIEDFKIRIINYLVDNIHDDNYYAFNNMDILNQILILTWGDKKNVEKASDKISKKIFRDCLKLQISTTIGISSILTNINDKLYKSAKKALDLRLIYGLNKIYREEQLKLSNEFVFPNNELKLLKKNIERRNIKNVEILLSEVFSKNRFKQSNAGNLYFVYSEVVNTIYETLYSTNIDAPKVIEYDLSEYDIMNYANKLEDIAMHLFKIIEERLKFKKNSPINCRELVEQAVKYIDMHYQDKINVKSLSTKFGINANYFSTIFKKELGITYTKYLTTQRLNYACRMLKETDINVEEVAKSVGYDDIQYFYRVFKKEFSVTPVEYRSGNIKLVK